MRKETGRSGVGGGGRKEGRREHVLCVEEDTFTNTALVQLGTVSNISKALGLRVSVSQTRGSKLGGGPIAKSLGSEQQSQDLAPATPALPSSSQPPPPCPPGLPAQPAAGAHTQIVCNWHSATGARLQGSLPLLLGNGKFCF